MAAITVRTTAAAEGCLTHLFSTSFDLKILALQQKLTPDYAGRADSVQASLVRLRSELGQPVFAHLVVKSEHETKCTIAQSRGDQHRENHPTAVLSRDESGIGTYRGENHVAAR